MPEEKQYFYVVLGASNLTYILRHVVRYIVKNSIDQTYIYAAHGPGRSYGIEASIGLYQYLAISDCKLFKHIAKHIAESPNPVIKVLITDIGNDIMYMQDIDDLETWVNHCIAQLSELRVEKMVISKLPEQSVSTMPKSRYSILRRIYFPRCSYSFDQMIERVMDVNQRLQDNAELMNYDLVTPPPKWYGPDRFHFRYFKRRAAAELMLNPLVEGQGEKPLSIPAYKVQMKPLNQYWRLGKKKKHKQDGMKIADNVWYYAY